MITQNATQKKVIQALANAPRAALLELIKQTTDKEECEQIKRIAAAVGVKLEG